MSLVLLVRQDQVQARALLPLTAGAVELHLRLEVLHLLLLQVLQGPLCHRHLAALPLHLLLGPLVPLSALPWLQALEPPKEQSQTE